MDEELNSDKCIVPPRDLDSQIPEGYEHIVNLSQLQLVKEAVKDYGQIIREKLRSKTGLTAYLGSQGIEMTYSNKVPDSFDQLIKQIGPSFWLIRQKQPLIVEGKRTADFIETFLFDGFPAVGKTFGLDQSDRATLTDYQKLMKKLLAEISKIRIKEKMQEINEDIFGAYFPIDRRIEIYWIAIAIFSESINVPIEEFTKIILTHEFAHGFTHVGLDLDRNRWDTEKFCNAEDNLIEGLAQYYTATITKEMRDRLSHPEIVDAYYAYEKLLEYQPSAYHAHKVWLKHEGKVLGEAIRFAILEARRLEQRCTHEIFSEMIVANLRRLS